MIAYISETFSCQPRLYRQTINSQFNTVRIRILEVSIHGSVIKVPRKIRLVRNATFVALISIKHFLTITDTSFFTTDWSRSERNGRFRYSAYKNNSFAPDRKPRNQIGYEIVTVLFLKLIWKYSLPPVIWSEFYIAVRS